MNGDGRADRTPARAGIGAGSGVAATGLLVFNDRAAALLGIDPGSMRAIALADLALVPGLVAGRPRWPWVAGRVALHVAIAARLLAGGRTLGRVGAGALALASAGDLQVAATLRRL